MNRIDAAQQGLTRYSTGKPCARGHISERYVSTGGCIACLMGARNLLRQTQLSASRGELEVTVRVPREFAPLVHLLERVTKDERAPQAQVMLETLRRPSDAIQGPHVTLPEPDEMARKMTERGRVLDPEGRWVRLFFKDGELLRPVTGLAPDDPRRAWPIKHDTAHSMAVLTPPDEDAQ